MNGSGASLGQGPSDPAITLKGYYVLQKRLEGVHLFPEGVDSLIWTPQKTGIFSIKSACLELAKASPHLMPDPIKGIWKGLIPPRIEMFAWLALLGKINTKDKLARMGIIREDENLCVLCESSPENYNHLLLHCPFSWKVWNSWLSIWNLKWTFPPTIREAFDQWKFINKGCFFKKVWAAIFFILIWTIWKERNARIFNNISCSPSQIFELALLRLRWWISGWTERFPYSFNDILHNPSCLMWVDSSSALTTPKPPKQIIHWEPPPEDHQKWNVDASVFNSPHRAAIGGVLRNSKGNFTCMFSSPIPPIEINYAEVLAIHRAIQISLRSQPTPNHPILIESDSHNAVKWSNDDNGGPWNLNFQLNFIRRAIKGGKVRIIHRGRGSNIVADLLAKQGHTRSDEFIAWI
ncbi:uncharacterized protein LOC125492440 [Beta vulgaris subsp. vulgaris]|uniref:uncharacterized protein LOC125492440 n=1 Tax=Beta vulgaris subsp. vulgaris TaxID=3555 RepID=UPI002036E3CA|nr:uncharacterized protein LOC125492440 [Beta vulgaris subsp. vulgaris]